MSDILNEALADLRTEHGALAPPGIALAVASGTRVASAVDGVRIRAGSVPGVGADLPMTLGTAHDLASITKVVGTTASLARLVAAGAVTVDDRVRSIVPTAPVDDATTLRHLLLHRAGLWEWWPLYLPATTDRAATYARLDALPRRYGLDEARHYSDLGFILLGRIVETVTGGSLEDAVAELVTTPLGLRDTRFARPVRAADVAASGYGDAIEERMIARGEPYPVPVDAADFAEWRSGVVVGEVADGNAFHAFRGVSGHAGLFSTVPDLLAIARALAGDDFLPVEVRDAFAAPGPDPEQALGFRRGSMVVGGRDLPLLYHPGYTGGTVGWVPGHDIAVVLLTNRLHAAAAQGAGPVPTDALWRPALVAAGRWLDGR